MGDGYAKIMKIECKLIEGICQWANKNFILDPEIVILGSTHREEVGSKQFSSLSPVVVVMCIN